MTNTLAPDPTNPDTLSGMRDFLISEGVVRDPRVAGTAPPLWLAPAEGCPAPGAGQGLSPVEVGPTAVLSAARATGIPSPPYEGFRRTDMVEFVLRTTTAQIAYSLENQLRAALNDKRAWLMGDVPVNESLLFRDLQPITSGPLGFTFTLEYMFSLWGPFTPVGP